jgi:hypothetical protein
MKTVTQPTQSLIRFELTQEQTELILIALQALDMSVNNPGESISEVIKAAQWNFGIEQCPAVDDDGTLGITVDTIFKPYYTATHLNKDELIPLNDDEFGESAEIISIMPGESLEVEPS